MASEELHYAGLEYVGDAKDGMTTWRTEDGDEVDLHPTTVMRHGLGDKLRAGLAAVTDYDQEGDQTRALVKKKDRLAPERIHVQEQLLDNGAKVYQDVQDAGDSKRERLERDEMTLVGGHNDNWRWSFVTDGDELFIAIDNRPAIDSTSMGAHPPDFQHVVLPVDLLKQLLVGV